MYKVYLAVRNEPEGEGITASTLAQAKAVVTDFLQTHGRGRALIEGPNGGVVFEYPTEKISSGPELKRWLERAAAKDAERLKQQLAEVRATPWKARHR